MKIRVFDNKESLYENSAQCFAEVAAMAVADHGSMNVALAGGGTPKGLYRKLASSDYINNIHWDKINVYFGDERCVPLDHADSNYKMANEEFLNAVPIPDSHVYPMHTDSKNMLSSADDYARLINANLPKDEQGAAQFDLILLGMGDDGHTASLFPNTDILKETDKPVAGVYVEKLKTWRLSLTFPTINNANNVLILVAGEAKANILSEILNKNDGDNPYPIQGIDPVGNLLWYLDKPAAAQLDLE